MSGTSEEDHNPSIRYNFILPEVFFVFRFSYVYPFLSNVICVPDLQCFRQADVCFVIDSSGSICGTSQAGSTCDNWSLLLSFVNSIIDAFTVGEQQTRVGVVTFANDAVLVVPMNRYFNHQDLKTAVLSIGYTGGQTNTGEALHVVRTQCFSSNNGERAGVPNIAVVMTDGLPTVIEYDMNTEASLLKQQSTVLAVGITDSVEKPLLKTISSAPRRENENYFSTPDFSSLSNIIRALVVETCEATKVTQLPFVSGIRFLCIVTSLFTFRLKIKIIRALPSVGRYFYHDVFAALPEWLLACDSFFMLG